MKRVSILFVLMLFACSGDIFSGKGSIWKAGESKGSAEIKTYELVKLCEIDDEPWGYNETMGVVYTDYISKRRYAILTFKKRIPNHVESIKLKYDIASKKIKEITMDMDRVNLQGQSQVTLYSLDESDSNVSASLGFANNGTCFGTATFHGKMKYEQYKFQNDLLQVVVENLKFSEIQFMDLDAAANDLDEIMSKEQE